MENEQQKVYLVRMDGEKGERIFSNMIKVSSFIKSKYDKVYRAMKAKGYFYNGVFTVKKHVVE